MSGPPPSPPLPPKSVGQHVRDWAGVVAMVISAIFFLATSNSAVEVVRRDLDRQTEALKEMRREVQTMQRAQADRDAQVLQALATAKAERDALKQELRRMDRRCCDAHVR